MSGRLERPDPSAWVLARFLPLLLVSLPVAQVPAIEKGEASAKAPLDLAGAIETVRGDVDEARRRLVELRREITEQRVALARRVDQLSSEVGEMRRFRRRLRDEKSHAGEEADSSRQAAARREDELSLMRSLVTEAASRSEARLDAVGRVVHSEAIEEWRRLLAGEGSPPQAPAALAAATAEYLRFLADRAEESSRVSWVEGRAIDPAGREVTGTFVRLGALMSYFATDGESRIGGLVEPARGSERPHILLPPSVRQEAAIRDLVRGEDATVPVDVTGGAALRVSEATPSLIDQLRSGGVVVVPIVAIGVLCLLVAVAKIIQLALVRTSLDRPLADLLDLLASGNVAEARALAEGTPRPWGRILGEGVRHRELPRQDLEEILHEAILVEVPRLERWLSVLAVGAVVSPLLGLLGTVTGMIHTFRLIEIFGTGDARLLSGGISEALVTTMAGLSVAIPLVLIHAFLSRRVQAIADGMEKSAIGFLNGLKTLGRAAPAGMEAEERQGEDPPR